VTDEGRAARLHDTGSPLVGPQDTVPPTVGDLLRYLWGRRVRLLLLFVLLSGVGGIGLLGWWLFAPRSAHALVVLGFRGIERHEYPTGKSFSIEDLRSPKVLARALDEVGLPAGSTDLEELYRGIDIVPIVPITVVERWKKQARDGTKREEYLPSEFALEVRPKNLDDTERVQLLYALVKAYQEEVKYEQEAELQRMAAAKLPVIGLTTLYDYWDIPLLLRAQADLLATRLAVLIRDSQNFRDPEANLGFRDVNRELETWRDTRLETLAAVVHRERLVKDPDAMLRRLEERRANLDIELTRINAQVESATRLLEVVGQPQAVLAGQAAQREGAPLLDVPALEKILRSDYVGPVVSKMLLLQQEAAATAAARMRVQHEIELLGKRSDGWTDKPPPGFDELVTLVTTNLDEIVGRYEKVLDAYLDASVIRYVTMREGPHLRRPGARVALLAAAVVFTAAVLALLIVVLTDSLRPGARSGGPDQALRPT
jgi:hypothetical protein